MRLYYDPAATTCRPVMHFAVEHDLAFDLVHVDVFAGAAREPWFAAVNPDCGVPVLEDDGFRLTECSAILKYLADKLGSPAYPQGLHARARVNEAMDWFNTYFYRSVGYGLVYSQILPNYRPGTPAGRQEMLAQGLKAAELRLGVLDGRLAAGGPFVCGAEISLADYLGAPFVTLLELIDYDLTPYPAVRCWLAAIKARPAWDEVNAAFYGWRSAMQGESRATA